MFTLELDLRLFFVPPMEEWGRGIVLTRSLELPFPPYSGLLLYGRSMDVTDEPMGFHLKDVTWEVDRGVFLAHTVCVSQDASLAEVADEIDTWLDLGWRFGSYVDGYSRPDDRDSNEIDIGEVETDGFDYGDDREAWQRKPPRDRSRGFNRFFRSLIRFLVEEGNNEPVAFAMHTTKRFFTESEAREAKTPVARKFREAEQQYKKLSPDEQRAWRKRVCRTYPRLDRVFERDS